MFVLRSSISVQVIKFIWNNKYKYTGGLGVGVQISIGALEKKLKIDKRTGTFNWHTRIEIGDKVNLTLLINK